MGKSDYQRAADAQALAKKQQATQKISFLQQQ
jgi:hypothetical protein